MNTEEISRYGWRILRSEIKPAVEKPLAQFEVIGFDTEYRNEKHGRELLCFQLWHEDQGLLVPCRELTRARLYDGVKELFHKCGKPVHHRHLEGGFFLVTHFSIAELSHIKDYLEAKIFETADSYQAEWRTSDHRTIYIWDLYNWYQASLEEVARLYGDRKLEYDVRDLSRRALRSAQFREYALNDARLCYRIGSLLRERVWGDFGIDIVRSRTVAGTGASIFRKDFLKAPVIYRNPLIRRFSLRCSWGGNNQCFYRGRFDKGIFEEDFVEYDAKGMYSNTARIIEYFPEEKDLRATVDLEEFTREDARGGFCLVDFEFPSTVEYPSLPVQHEGKLIYPLEGRAYCTLYEIREAISQGAEIKLRMGFYYTRGNTALSDFMNVFLEKRREAPDEIADGLYKLFMNGLIGKFIQHIMVYDINDLIEFSRKSGFPLSWCMSVGNLIKAGVKERVHVGSIFVPEWNALITGRARATLARAFHENGGYLGTTDSVILSGSIREPVINGITFEEKARGDALVAYRTRLYAILYQGEPVKMAHHGIHSEKAAREILVDFLDTSKYTYVRRKPRKLREALASGEDFGEMVFRTMTVYLGWDHKRHLTGGGRSKPWRNIREMERRKDARPWLEI